jgi:hypothetical protein
MKLFFLLLLGNIHPLDAVADAFKQAHMTLILPSNYYFSPFIITSSFSVTLNLNQTGMIHNNDAIAVIRKGVCGLNFSHKKLPITGAGSDTSPKLVLNTPNATPVYLDQMGSPKKLYRLFQDHKLSKVQNQPRYHFHIRQLPPVQMHQLEVHRV